ncbi:MAG: hypothetical protein N2Z22_02040 [Turneriella sp.]|nr:hypothetical protein [Turneriella sp.]
MEFRPVNSFIIGIGENSRIVNKTLVRDAAAVESQKAFLTLSLVEDAKIDPDGHFRKREIVYSYHSLFGAAASEEVPDASDGDLNTTNNRKELQDLKSFLKQLDTEITDEAVCSFEEKLLAVLKETAEKLEARQQKSNSKACTTPRLDTVKIPLRELDRLAECYCIYSNLKEDSTTTHIKENIDQTSAPVDKKSFGLSIRAYSRLKQQIGETIETLSKYDAHVQERNLRIIVHAEINPQEVATLGGEGDTPRGTQTCFFSRNMFFVVMDILRHYSQHRGINIDVYPVLFFRANNDKRLLRGREQLLKTLIGFLERYAAPGNAGDWLRTAFLIGDVNNWNDPFTRSEHLTLLYLNVLVLAEIGNLTKELHLENDVFFRNNVLNGVFSEEILEQERQGFNYLLRRVLGDAFEQIPEELPEALKQHVFMHRLFELHKLLSLRVFAAMGIITKTFAFKTLRLKLHRELLGIAISTFLPDEDEKQQQRADEAHLAPLEKEFIINFVTNGLARKKVLKERHISTADFLADYVQNFVHHDSDFDELAFVLTAPGLLGSHTEVPLVSRLEALGQRYNPEKSGFGRENILEGDSFERIRASIKSLMERRPGNKVEYQNLVHECLEICRRILNYYGRYPEFFRKTFLDRKLIELQKLCNRENELRLQLLESFCSGLASLSLFNDELDPELREIADRMRNVDISESSSSKVNSIIINRSIFDLVLKARNDRAIWIVVKEILEQARLRLEVSLLPAIRKEYQEFIARSEDIRWKNLIGLRGKLEKTLVALDRLPNCATRKWWFGIAAFSLGLCFWPKLLPRVLFGPKLFFHKVGNAAMQFLGPGTVPGLFLDLWDVGYWAVFSLLALASYRASEFYYQFRQNRVLKALHDYVLYDLEVPAYLIFQKIRMQNLLKNAIRFFEDYHKKIIRINRYLSGLQKVLEQKKRELKPTVESQQQTGANNDYMSLNRRFFEGLKEEQNYGENKIFVNLVTNNQGGAEDRFESIRLQLRQANNRHVRIILRQLMLGHRNFTVDPAELVKNLEESTEIFLDLMEKPFEQIKKDSYDRLMRDENFKHFIPLALPNLEITSQIRSHIRYDLVQTDADNHFLQLFCTPHRFSLDDFRHLLTESWQEIKHAQNIAPALTTVTEPKKTTRSKRKKRR